MSQEKKIVIPDDDFRKSLTHERPEPRNDAPTGRQIPHSARQSGHTSSEESNSTANRDN